MANGWFALIGVVVGGVLNAGITALLSEGEDKRNARVAALLVMEDLMTSIPTMRRLKDNQTWGAIRRSQNFASRSAWEEQRSTLAHVLTIRGFISLSVAFEGLLNASRAAAEHADNDPIADSEGWSLTATYLEMKEGLSFLMRLVEMPSRFRLIKRRRFRRDQQAHVEKLIDRKKSYQDFVAKHSHAEGASNVMWPSFIERDAPKH